jgi:hypothetical protein
MESVCSRHIGDENAFLERSYAAGLPDYKLSYQNYQFLKVLGRVAFGTFYNLLVFLSRFGIFWYDLCLSGLFGMYFVPRKIWQPLLRGAAAVLTTNPLMNELSTLSLPFS